MTVVFDEDRPIVLFQRRDECNSGVRRISIVTVLDQLNYSGLRPADQAITNCADNPCARPESKLKWGPPYWPAFRPQIPERCR